METTNPKLARAIITKTAPRYEVKQGRDGTWRWTKIAGNNKVTGGARGYDTHENATRAAWQDIANTIAHADAIEVVVVKPPRKPRKPKLPAGVTKAVEA